jgi:DNA polymerase-3 subunit gamma/tau
VSAPVPAASPEAAAASFEPVSVPAAPVSLQQLRDAWPEILEAVQRASRSSWLVVYTATPRALDDDVLTLAFRSQNDVAGFRPRPGATESVSEHLRAAIADVLGLRVKFLPRVEDAPPQPERPAPTEERAPVEEPSASAAASGDPQATTRPEEAAPTEEAATPEDVASPEEAGPPTAQIDADGWAVVSIPPSYDDEPAASQPATKAGAAAPASRAVAPAPAKRTADKDPASGASGASGASRAPGTSGNRYGEAVVRELLKAEFIEEQQLAPRDAPVAFDVAPDDVPPPPEEDR